MFDYTPLISVIVPVYNVGEFLIPCLESLLAQTYKNLEILLIDDGSTDESGFRCDEYAQKDARIKVTHKKNGGVSSARNLGLDLAHGEYIAFVDADDRVTADYIEILYRELLEQDADIVCCNFAMMDESGNRLNSHSRDAQGVCPNVKNIRILENNHEIFSDILGRKELYFTHAVAKLIYAPLVKQCRFPSMKFSEDTMFMFDLFCRNPRVYLTPYPGYQCVIRSSSATRSVEKYNLQHPQDTVRLAAHQYDYFCQKMSSLHDSFLNAYADALYYYAYIAAQACNRKNRKTCRQEIIKHFRKIQMKNHLSSSLRLKLAVYVQMPWLFNLYARFNERIRG